VDEATARGTTRMREVIEAQIKGGAPTESWLEDRLVELIRRYGLPEPVRQYRLETMRFDLAYPEVPLDVEADSRLWHTTPADRRRDEARDAAARLAGWAVERVTWLQMEEEPAAVAARIGRWLQTAQQVA
jgi:very-short-patch-repair endonuclease